LQQRHEPGHVDGEHPHDRNPARVPAQLSGIGHLVFHHAFRHRPVQLRVASQRADVVRSKHQRPQGNGRGTHQRRHICREVYGACDSVTNNATSRWPSRRRSRSSARQRIRVHLSGDITVLAQVEDLDSTVTNVEFFAMTNSAGDTNLPAPAALFSSTNEIGQTVSGPPYFIVWTNVTPGTYYLGAQGTDAMGLSGLSQIVTIQVIRARRSRWSASSSTIRRRISTSRSCASRTPPTRLWTRCASTC